jgi:hypothetical protein
MCYLSVVLLYYCHRVKAQLQINIYIYIYIYIYTHTRTGDVRGDHRGHVVKAKDHVRPRFSPTPQLGVDLAFYPVHTGPDGRKIL